jgi:DNA-binding GntR family transcriptional regulator
MATKAFERLIDAILRGDLPGGFPLREARLAREWDVGRTPLREAVRRAAEGGFLVLRPNHAPTVRKLTRSDISDMYDLRALLETHALRAAWSRIDESVLERLSERAVEAKPDRRRDWQRRCLRFDRTLHRSWTERCGNRWLRRDIDRQHQFWRIFQSWVGRDDRALRKAYAEHLEIFAAMHARDLARAVRKLRRHIRASADGAVDALPRQRADRERMPLEVDRCGT